MTAPIRIRKSYVRGHRLLEEHFENRGPTLELQGAGVSRMYQSREIVEGRMDFPSVGRRIYVQQLIVVETTHDRK